nr:hypothetical protein [Candidatus Sigynarchaeota archaeon]
MVQQQTLARGREMSAEQRDIPRISTVLKVIVALYFSIASLWIVMDSLSLVGPYIFYYLSFEIYVLLISFLQMCAFIASVVLAICLIWTGICAHRPNIELVGIFSAAIIIVSSMIDYLVGPLLHPTIIENPPYVILPENYVILYLTFYLIIPVSLRTASVMPVLKDAKKNKFPVAYAMVLLFFIFVPFIANMIPFLTLNGHIGENIMLAIRIISIMGYGINIVLAFYFIAVLKQLKAKNLVVKVLPVRDIPKTTMKPQKCAACGRPMKDRRCTSCTVAWCSNCGTWNPPEVERCVACNFLLPLTKGKTRP